MIGIVVLLPAFIPRGPLINDFVTKESQQCHLYGAWNFLYLQNFFHPDKMVR